MTVEPVQHPDATGRRSSSARPGPSPPSGSRGLLIAAGIFAIVLGAVAILIPAVASIGTALFIGWLLLAASVAALVDAFAVRDWGRTGLRLLVAALTFAAGLYLVAAPLRGVLTLTVILLLWFVAQGIAQIAAGVANRKTPGAGLTVVSGVISLVLGVLLALELPGSATWAVGLLVGIDLLTHGFAALALAGQVGRSSTGQDLPASSGPPVR